MHYKLTRMRYQMEDTHILFEKIIQEGYVDTGLSIEASQHRRDFLDSIQSNGDVLSTATAYLQSFTHLCQELKDSRAKLRSQPLFLWNKQGSSSWMYERMNVERIIADAYVTAAEKETDLKKRRVHYSEAIKYSLRAFNTMQKMTWEDASMTFLPIFQDRFHMYHIAKNTALHYKTMNDYAVAQNGEGNKTCIRKAFEYMDVAANIWAEDVASIKLLHEFRALHTLNIVSDMPVDQCGEKTAILSRLIGIKETPEAVRVEHRRLKQQNENVYYQLEESDKTISPLSLKELFHTLPVTLEDK